MRYTYLVIDTGKSVYAVKSEAEKQVEFLNELYIGRYKHDW